ncbi:MAG: S-methyl-5-thioribose-1-phosphate isomerase [Candidatus Thermoplasmatota archaeon]|nr:S-methyl-5-thioribose-1-phosphate isomerase [Candidatus Thermoplasmatota archaeon]
MNVEGKEYHALWFENDAIRFIDQRKLPYTFEFYTAHTVDACVFAIKDMVVRGAPAIGVAAAYGMVLGQKDSDGAADKLRKTRPTAYDLFYSIKYMTDGVANGKDALTLANTYAKTIINKCRRIGEHGERLIGDGATILTHCNAGALATVDYGTALAPLRNAHKKKKKMFVFVDETRPRLQGMLTAWELEQEGINYALIADNAAGHFMKKGEIDVVITGADRIAKNGDVANKIGTYEKAVLAKENDIPFYVAAPISTFDNALQCGEEIVIEQRKRDEVLQVNDCDIMPGWINVKNPAFDITPAKYITGYITEKGIEKC